VSPAVHFHAQALEPGTVPSPDTPGRRAFHEALPGYVPTPLLDLPALAEELGVREVRVKDESQRLELGAFKALGASYAMARWLQEESRRAGSDPGDLAAALSAPPPPTPHTFAAATDGNHGRAVAWTARVLGHRATIYIPAHSAPARVQHLRDQGAEVVLVDGSYDDAVARCAADAEERGWQVIGDTAWGDYEEIPGWVTDGYATLFEEITEQGMGAPDVVLLQCGVGSLAAAGAAAYRDGEPTGTRLVCVEPVGAACAYESARAGASTTATGSLQTIMAGLNCGTLLLRDHFDLFLALDDAWAEAAMRRAWHPLGEDPRFTSGESGAAGLAGLLALAATPEAAAAIGLGPESSVLVLNTEGATDPENWEQVVATPP
jgi:diaminopropionate ammonia-lyase